MSYEDPIDATGYDYEQWIRFAFDHPLEPKWWYYTEEFDFVCSPRAVITYYTRLFRAPHASLTVYDDATVDQGLWFVLSQRQLGEWLWDTKLPVRLRRECIAAMPTMFRDFFVDRPLDGVRVGCGGTCCARSTTSLISASSRR